MAVLIILIFGCAIFFIVYLQKMLNNKSNLCSPHNSEESPTVISDFLKRYASFRISVSSLIDIALIASTCFIVRILKRDVPKQYSQEIFRVRCIYITFIIAYSTWIVYDISWVISF